MNLENHNLQNVTEELLTLRDYIRWAYSRFNVAHLYYGHGTDNAWDEAVNLILTSLHLPPDASPDLLNSRLTLVERREICELIIRRIEERVPAAYLTKEAWFAGLPFYIDQRVIIPRSPLAELIEKEFSPWLDPSAVYHILDLCTGSGCIAIACACAFIGVEVDAVDISPQALEVAKINVEKHHLEDQVHLIESDLYEQVTEKYDLIVSNPPYVSTKEYKSLPKEYHHEPIIALEAKDEGLALVRKIILGAAEHLTPQGILVVEVGNSQDALCKRYPQVPFIWVEFERGGEGVFVLPAHEVQQFQHLFAEE